MQWACTGRAVRGRVRIERAGLAGCELAHREAYELAALAGVWPLVRAALVAEDLEDHPKIVFSR